MTISYNQVRKIMFHDVNPFGFSELTEEVGARVGYHPLLDFARVRNGYLNLTNVT